MRLSLNRTLVCCLATFLCLFFCHSLATNESDDAAVTYTQRSFKVHGKPRILLSGSIHYHRVPPSDWNNTFQLAKELGLNAIQTYVIWSAHEPEPGKDPYWEGDADLVRFIQLAAANDLYVVLRIGPYICGEYYFGGIPLWMRHVQDEQGNQIECFRCSDPLWKREMQRWVSIVVDKVRPQLASNGGPILWMQVENEYEPDNAYLEWAVNMARNVTTDVPWSLCGHAIDQCNQLNGFGAHEEKTKDIALCTINGFWMDQSKNGDQPSPTYFHKLWPQNPAQPAVWTEDQGWFDVWGMGRRVRSTSDQIYGIARFLAYGGSYHNFYMLTGGNNYERRAGRDATTAYAADTAIDNLLLRHEPRFSSLRHFFAVVRSVEEELLKHAAPLAPIPLKPSSLPASSESSSSAEAHTYGHLAFLSNFGEGIGSSNYFDFGKNSYFLPNHTVVLLDTSTNTVLYNTSIVEDKTHLRTSNSKRERIPVDSWVFFQEKVGYGAITNAPQSSPEQLNITDNKSDYMWYSFKTSHVGNVSVKAIGEGGLQYVYVNGVAKDAIGNDAATSADRALLQDVAPSGGDKTKVDILSVAMGLTNKKKASVDVLSVAMGLTNGGKAASVDILSVAMGMSTSVRPTTGKGIESVTIGKDNPPQTRFATSWKLKGEEKEIYTAQGSKKVNWKPLPSPQLRPNDSLLWLQGRFDLPKWLHPFVGGAQPNQTALVVNLNGLNKGVAYVNDFNIGRYWLVPGHCDGDCAPPRHGQHCYLHYTHCGKPTQDVYHIPFEVLEPSGNMITLFEEAPSSKQRNLGDVFLEIVHQHPS